MVTKSPDAKFYPQSGPDDRRSYLIAQMSDLHLGFGCGGTAPADLNDTPNLRRLEQCLSDLASIPTTPDLLLISGDLVEGGENWAYPVLAKALEALEIPVLFALGNHDDRDAFRAIFGSSGFTHGKLHHSSWHGPLRIVVIDTLKPGYHQAQFTQQDAYWLDATLSNAPNTPTLLVMHHAPIETGIPWMTLRETATWTQRFAEALSGHEHVVHIMAGHIHTPIHGMFGSVPVSVSASVAPAVALDLRPLAKKPDGRALIVNDDPGYTLYHWNGTALTAYPRRVQNPEVLLRLDAEHAFIPDMTLDLNR